MAASPPYIKANSYVAVGSFNPVIVLPQWLVAKSLISEDFLETFKMDFAHSDATQFVVNDFRFTVTRQSFCIETQFEEKFEELQGLFIALFEVLSETMVTALGINTNYHYEYDLSNPTRKYAYTKFGHNIVPKDDLWNKVLDDPLLARVNLRSNQIEGLNGNINVSVGLSALLAENKKDGIEIQVNNHSKIENETSDGSSVHKMLDIIRNHGRKILENNENIIVSINQYGSEGNL